MKNVLIGLLVVLMLAGGVGGTWYYMDMQVKAANERTNTTQGELQGVKAQVTTLEADLKAKADMETAQQTLLNNLETLLMMGSGSDITALETYYDAALLAEGSIPGVSLRSYSLGLQKYWESLSENEGVKAVPIKFASGDWSIAVRVQEENITAPLILNQSGSVVRAPAKIGQEMFLTLAKWKEGKIIEQYEFAYSGDMSKSNLLKYIITPETQTQDMSMIQTGSGASDAPMIGENDIIPAESSPGSSTATSPTQSATGTVNPNEA